ncbi:MAG TPA: hemerythrin domain-containing protein [Terriglobales bacterium]|nr:hemerythrin domain-containing protein [Terriglobales bacterium]
MKATELLKQQHNQVKKLFQQLEKTEDSEQRYELLQEITQSLEGHMLIEEEIFYPAVREGAGTKKVQEMVPEAYEEHHVVKLVIADLPKVDPSDERFQAKMTVLKELIEHHVEEEEKDLFKGAEKLGATRLEELATEMEQRLMEAQGEESEGEDEFEDDLEDEDELGDELDEDEDELDEGDDELDDDFEDDELEDEEDEDRPGSSRTAEQPHATGRRR